ncbi:MAG: response regulator transcription factor [Candidatus Eremiobacteraeota bacterium]|nr:response regulator transcription factor [Candidatus Eremiobacteraeota bacterium]
MILTGARSTREEPPTHFLVGKQILVVDDEPQIVEVIDAYLKRDGFTTLLRDSVAGAMEVIERDSPDMMILDINLPDGTGLDIIRQSREMYRIPTILLTARTEEIDRIVGLELGADDYVTKPFSPGELVARVRALFRRVNDVDLRAPNAPIKIRGLEFDEARHEVRIDGKLADLTPSEFEILRVLAQSPDQVFTRAQLLDLLGDDGSIFERTLDRHVNNLRRKIEPHASDPEYVQTVYGVGYKLKGSS